ncbi:XRE family transcriptional regulator [Spongiactinospora rosea]|nr:XRE family transcriptional regulator [Spongiactinospora rosea]
MAKRTADPDKLNHALHKARIQKESPTWAGSELSRQELADLVNQWIHQHSGQMSALDAGYIGKLERGEIRWPSASYRSGLRAVLEVQTDAELGFSPPRRTLQPIDNVDDVDRKQFLSAAALGLGATFTPSALSALIEPAKPTPIPAKIGMTEIQEIRTVAQTFSQWDEQYGGGLLRPAVTAQLRHAVALLDARCPDKLHDELYSAVAYLSGVAGFMAFDIYDHETASRQYRLALMCAEEAGDFQQRAIILASMARQALWRNDPDTTLTRIEMAQVRSDRLTPAARAMLSAVRSRALAQLSRDQEAIAAVGLADDLFADITAIDTSGPLHWYDAAEHAGETGHTLAELSHAPSREEGIRRLTTAAATHRDTSARARAFTLLLVARLHIAGADPHEGAAIGAEIVDRAASVRSHRIRDYLIDLRKTTRQHPKISEMADLRDRINVALTSA